MAYDSQQQPAPPAQPHAAGGPSGPRASFWARFGAFIIDYLVQLVVVVIFVVGFAAISDSLAVIGYLIAFVLIIAYFVMLEGGATGQTLGKRAVGIRVYDLKQGGPIGYGRAFIRWIGRIPSGLILYLGYLWAIWDGEKQTWHDKFAGSVVVPTQAYPVE